MFERAMSWAAVSALVISGAFGAQALANPGAYSGPFAIQPLVYHPARISGQMAVRASGGEVRSIRLTLDEAVLGRAAFDSKEQWMASVDGGKQVSIVFKLEGPTHGWYFVLVGASADGGRTISGPIYKAKGRLAEIQAIAQSPIAAPPAGWKSVGTATLKEEL